jgi:Fic-DOC domain mobile mystery protein B
LIDPLLEVGDGDTDLSDEDQLGLIPSYIAKRGELFEAEQRNIAEALLRPAPTLSRLLADKYLRDLHAAMFGEVWDWAGKYRTRETNLGIDPTAISTQLRALVDDVRTWIELGTFDVDEIAVRFHHRLVAIHPFVNGNGRHGRAAANYLIAALGNEPFSWGAGLDLNTAELRKEYRVALQQADGGDITALKKFARN